MRPKLKVTSIDDVLRWLDVELDQDLPNPETVELSIYRRAVLQPNLSVAATTPPLISSNIVTYTQETFVKDRIMFKGRTLYVWRKE
jgi:hypothetical protein